MTQRYCRQCFVKIPSGRTRRRQILGEKFFQVLTLRDLTLQQRETLHYQAAHCSEECATAAEVKKILSHQAGNIRAYPFVMLPKKP